MIRQPDVVDVEQGDEVRLAGQDRGVAYRRQREMQARGEEVSFNEVLKAQDERDRRDAARDLAPMKPADDAIRLDTTSLTVEQVVEQMEQRVRACR